MSELTWRANAEAHLLQARQRHGARLGSKKSRNGCSVCKGRRIKCDELRPECRRCQDSGRTCRYDSPSSPGGKPAHLLRYPRDGRREDVLEVALETLRSFCISEMVLITFDADSNKSIKPLIGPTMAQMLSLRDVDRRTFDYFISHTAPRLAGAWDKEFWCNNVLQLAQLEPFVLDSLLAISVLYEHPQYLASFDGTPGESPNANFPGTGFEGLRVPDEHLTHALQFYNKAIQRLTLQMNEGKATPAVALLSCVLFICIETIRDDVFAAMSLFMQGTNMLKNVDRSKLSSDEESMLTLVEHIFQRMAVQAVLYGHPSGASLRHDLKANTHAEFDTLAGARGSLFSLAVSSHSFFQQADHFRQTVLDAKTSNVSRETHSSDDLMHGLEMFGITRDAKSIFYGSPDGFDGEKELEEHGAFNALRTFFDRLGPDSTTDMLWDAQDLATQKFELLARLKQWEEEFRLLLKGADTSCEHSPEAVSYLHLYHLASSVWVSTRLVTTETVFDSFTDQFRELLRHAEVYVRATARQLPIFTFEIGAVLPLFLTASKCRVPSLRRQALDLMLQCPKKESTFGAYSCAQAICRLISIEENGLGLPPPDLSGRCSLRAIDDDIWISEDRRIHSFDLLKNRKARTYEMRATRYRTVNGYLERVVEDFAI